MAKDISDGIFYKQVKDSDGKVTGKIPFLTRTIANLVYLNDGRSVQRAIDDLNYHAITILSFTNTVDISELGSTVGSVRMSWQLSKPAKEISINGKSIINMDNSTNGEYAMTSVAIRTNTTYTLTVKDDRDTTVSKSTYISFYNGIYYGVGFSDVTIDSAFILSLKKVLQSSRITSFTPTTTADKHIYFAIPTRYGIPLFNVGGFDGGFDKVSTFEFTNESGYTESYDVYRSTNAGVGGKLVKVS